jgi:hypothetical protein
MATQTATTEPGVLRHGVEEEESSGSSDEEEESGSGSSEEEEEEEDNINIEDADNEKDLMHQQTNNHQNVMFLDCFPPNLLRTKFEDLSVRDLRELHSCEYLM